MSEGGGDSSIVLAEVGDDEAFVGPTFSGPTDPCLQCFRSRRDFSGTPPARMAWLDPVALLTLPQNVVRLLHDHQVGHDSAHLFLPFPGCKCARRPLSGTWERADAVSARLGLVQDVRVSREALEIQGTGPADEAVEYVARSMPSRTPGTSGLTVLAGGCGRGPTASAAELRAVAESVERYCAGFWNHSESTRLLGSGSGATVLGQVLATAPGGEGVRPSGARVPVPAHMVFLPYPGSPTVQESVGLAAGSSFQRALEGALAEQVERQSFWEAANGEVTEIWRDRAAGAEIYGWSADLGFTVACAIRRRPTPPFVTLGLGCSPDRQQALDKALSERRHVEAALRRAVQEDLGLVPKSKMDEMLWRLATDVYAGDKLLRSLARPHAVATVSTQPVYVSIDLTTQDVAMMNWAVVRVIAIPPHFV